MESTTPPQQWRMFGHGIKALSAIVLIGGLMAVTLPAPQAQAAVSGWQQKGITYYPTSASDYGSSTFQQTVDHYKSLGFNTITLIVQVYQSNTGSTDIGSGWNTPTDASLATAIQYVHSQGMQVMLKIHLDSYDGQWRAYINPGDRATWYANYLTMLKHYGQIAASNNVEAYCLGTELIDMASSVKNGDNTQQWANMISQVRQIYHGKLTYDANWGSDTNTGEAQYIQFWNALDFIGISAYYPLYGDGSAAQDQSAWNNWNSSEIQKIENQWQKPIVFTEVGYRSVDNAHNAPYDSWDNGNYNAQEQMNAYQGLFAYWNDYSWMQGIDIWYGTANPNAGGSGNTDYFVYNKPVEGTLQSWFTQGGTSGSSGGTGTSTGSTGGTGTQGTFTSTGSANPSSAATGQSVTFSGTVQNSGAAGSNENIDLEVYDSTAHQMTQKVFSNQNFTAGQSQAYSLAWTPNSTGTFTFKIGVFDSNWKLLNWNDNAAQVTVGSASTGGSSGGGTGTTTGSTGGNSGGNGGTGTSTPPTNSTLDIWWPTNGTTVSGVQPFKAMLENLALSAYSMFWQVDNGQLNQMSDNQTDYPHKEAQVDVGGWSWNGNGPYNITFSAKDAAGNLLAQKSVSITVAR